MSERRVINRIALMQKLQTMPYEDISELQMHHLFTTMGKIIEIEAEESDVNCDTN